MNRRNFLAKSLTATAALAALPARAAQPSGAQEYYQLRVYRLKAGADHTLLDNYLEKAAIPALNRLGCKPIGVFTEIEPKGDPSVYVLVPYPNLETFASAAKRMRADPEYMKAGADYFEVPKDHPAFVRIDSWLMLAFAGIPRIELPAYSREKQDRIFELRTYESHSEAKAVRKVEMFNDGEIDVMREVGLGPVFFGQALVGPSLPHLTYMLSAENKAAHDKHWGAFGKHPTWKKMEGDPKYKDTVSSIRNWFLKPASFSQI